jgi:SSS family solute:Na+ symporter
VALNQPTFWVVLIYGLAINLQNFGIDQSYVQRYITAKSDRAARRSVWIGALLYLPIGGAFFFIGTALWAFYETHPELLAPSLNAAAHPDAVFPYYISRQLPAGLAGLVVAGLCAAAMDSNLNCMSTLFLKDLYLRYLRPRASERESMRVLHGSTLAFGLISIGAALAMISIKSALDTWWQLAGILGGGMLGLFLLGMITRASTNRAAVVGVVTGLVVIVWMTFSPGLVRPAGASAQPLSWFSHHRLWHGGDPGRRPAGHGVLQARRGPHSELRDDPGSGLPRRWEWCLLSPCSPPSVN